MVRETQELAQIRVGLEEVMCYFQELEDPLEPINIKHSLESVVVIAIMGILAGAAGPTSIAEWAKSKSEFSLTSCRWSTACRARMSFGQFECDEVYVVAGHKGHPEAVK